MAFKPAKIARSNYYDSLETGRYEEMIQSDIDSNSDKTKSIMYGFVDDEVKEKCADYVSTHRQDLEDAGYDVEIEEGVSVTISWA
ncbi:hypothetical protein [Weissella viridescens]|uniref:hypothetical protein n=1 Tax=Weissella viridescens TaxID=1629 RepID=UPI003AF25CCB